MNWLMGVGILVVLAVAPIVYLSVILYWGDEQTQGVRYFGRTPAGRARFRRTLRRHAVVLSPVIRVLSRFTPFTFEQASFTYKGLTGPKGTCTAESFERAHEYEVQPEDVFVATQMKCGTTWMQHVVYQVLTRGRGNLVESGVALYAVSPWLESIKSVSVDDAPLVGTERPSRIIKTHFPADRCPFDIRAKYVYVARHPVSCFASCADFIAENAGPFAPALGAVEDWYCSEDRMWWGNWPAHVEGWWEMATRHDNMFFVSFEEMKQNLATVAVRLADFLSVAPLSPDELAEVLAKCAFEYMRDHSDTFEMHPPHILAVKAELFRSGTTERFCDVPEATREHIGNWCLERLRGRAFPLAEWYPDLGNGLSSSG